MAAYLGDFARWPALSGIVGVIYCDTAADLPGVNDFPEGTLVIGSKAKDVSTGDEYMMDSSGTWNIQPAGSSVSLDLTGYYTAAQIDSMLAGYYTSAQIDSTLANYYTDSETDLAINGAITSTQYSDLGTSVSDATDLDTLKLPGKYYKANNAATCTNLPSTWQGAAFTLLVEYTTSQNGTRLRHTLIPAAPVSSTAFPHMYIRYMTGSSPGTWQPWVDFVGTVL